MKTEIINIENRSFLVFPNDGITQHIKKHGNWEPHFKILIDKIINLDDVVLDAGANFGYNSVLLGEKISQGHLIAFEPQRIIFQQLNANLLLNNILNTTVYQLALSNKNEETELSPINYNQYWVNMGDLSIGTGGEKIKTIKLDDLNLKKLDFIKIDIQGYELFFLEGASQTLKNLKPDLFIEIEPHQLAKFNITESQLINYIKYLGYKIFKINNDYPCDHICTHSPEKLQNINLPLTEI